MNSFALLAEGTPPITPSTTGIWPPITLATGSNTLIAKVRSIDSSRRPRSPRIREGFYPSSSCAIYVFTALFMVTGRINEGPVASFCTGPAQGKRSHMA